MIQIYGISTTVYIGSTHVLICELKPRLHNSIIISRSGLCLATVTVPSNLLERLPKDSTGCAHSFPPLYYLLIVIFASVCKTITCDTICTADDHGKIACKEGASKGEIIYTKILRLSYGCGYGV
jgi:hypothetical protein